MSEKADELFDSFTKATASRPANWSSPATKSADKESLQSKVPEARLATQESVDPHDKEGQTLLSEGFVSLPIRSCQQVSSTYRIPTKTHTLSLSAPWFSRGVEINLAPTSKP